MTRSVSSYRFQLPKITEEQVEKVSNDYRKSGGYTIDEKLDRLFESFPSNKDCDEVKIKVAALNTIYATSINYIQPVVDKLVDSIPMDTTNFNYSDFTALVDEIATATWVSPTTGKTHERCNLSFASKYVHFLSKHEIPIYDSYIWIVMRGYMGQLSKSKFSYSAPNSYADFHKLFCEFKTEFSLSQYSNYNIDKYLWQHGKNLINQMMTEFRIPLPDAKRRLQSEMKERVY